MAGTNRSGNNPFISPSRPDALRIVLPDNTRRVSLRQAGSVDPGGIDFEQLKQIQRYINEESRRKQNAPNPYTTPPNDIRRGGIAPPDKTRVAPPLLPPKPSYNPQPVNTSPVTPPVTDSGTTKRAPSKSGGSKRRKSRPVRRRAKTAAPQSPALDITPVTPIDEPRFTPPPPPPIRPVEMPQLPQSTQPQEKKKIEAQHRNLDTGGRLSGPSGSIYDPSEPSWNVSSPDIRTWAEYALRDYAEMKMRGASDDEIQNFLNKSRQDVRGILSNSLGIDNEKILDRITDYYMNFIERNRRKYEDYLSDLYASANLQVNNSGRGNLIEAPTVQIDVRSFLTSGGIPNMRALTPQLGNELKKSVDQYNVMYREIVENKNKQLDDLYNQLVKAQRLYGDNNPTTQELLRRYNVEFSAYKDWLNRYRPDRIQQMYNSAYGYSHPLGVLFQDDLQAQSMIDTMRQAVADATGYVIDPSTGEFVRKGNGIVDISKGDVKNYYNIIDNFQNQVFDPANARVGSDQSLYSSPVVIYNRGYAPPEYIQELQNQNAVANAKVKDVHRVGTLEGTTIDDENAEYFTRAMNAIPTMVIPRRQIKEDGTEEYVPDPSEAMKYLSSVLRIPDISLKSEYDMMQSSDPRERKVASFYNSFWINAQSWIRETSAKHPEWMYSFIKTVWDNARKRVAQYAASTMRQYFEKKYESEKDNKNIPNNQYVISMTRDAGTPPSDASAKIVTYDSLPALLNIGGDIATIFRQLGSNPAGVYIGNTPLNEYIKISLARAVASRGVKSSDGKYAKIDTANLMQAYRDAVDDVINQLKNGNMAEGVYEKVPGDLSKVELTPEAVQRSAVSNMLKNLMSGNISGYAAGNSPLTYAFFIPQFMGGVYNAWYSDPNYRDMRIYLENLANEINNYGTTTEGNTIVNEKITKDYKNIINFLLNSYYPYALHQSRVKSRQRRK